MLSFRIAAILLFVVKIDFLMVLTESTISLKTGDSAPEFNLRGIDDNMHSLNDYSKKGLLIIFMCNHCPYVKAKINAIKELHDKFKDHISIVGINSNDSVKYPDDDFDSMKAVAKDKCLEIDFFMALTESTISLKTGDSAPEFNLKGIDDNMHSLNDYSKKGLLIIFMCNHCPYVKAKINAIKELHDKFKDHISIVGINSNDSMKYPDDSFDSMKVVAKEKGLKIDYLVDETQEIAKKYGAVCTPDPFLFDSEKKLVFHGRIDDAMNPDAEVTEKVMVNNIEKFLDGQKIEKEFDPSIGCSIKWKEQQT